MTNIHYYIRKEKKITLKISVEKKYILKKKSWNIYKKNFLKIMKSIL